MHGNHRRTAPGNGIPVASKTCINDCNAEETPTVATDECAVEMAGRNGSGYFRRIMFPAN
jgi:hypothetical protein